MSACGRQREGRIPEVLFAPLGARHASTLPLHAATTPHKTEQKLMKICLCAGLNGGQKNSNPVNPSFYPRFCRRFQWRGAEITQSLAGPGECSETSCLPLSAPIHGHVVSCFDSADHYPSTIQQPLPFLMMFE